MRGRMLELPLKPLLNIAFVSGLLLSLITAHQSKLFFNAENDNGSEFKMFEIFKSQFIN